MRLVKILFSPKGLVLAGFLVVGSGLGAASVLRNPSATVASDADKPAAQATPAADAKASLGYADAGATPGKASADPHASPYETAQVEVVRRSVTLPLTGSLVADEQSAVASNTSGIVAEIHVDRGSVVKKGDVLVQLDPTDAKNRLAEGTALAEEFRVKLQLRDASAPFNPEDQPEVRLAKTSLSLAISRLERAQKLVSQRAVSADDFEQCTAERECAAQRYQQSLQQVRQTYQSYQTAVVRLTTLRKAVKDTTILAPFDGLVAEKHVAIGEQVTAGFVASKIVTLVRINPLRVCLTVPQQSIGRIQPGQKVLFQADSFPGKTFEAEVRYISPVVTGESRSMMVEGLMANPGGLLRPGLFVTAQLELPEQRTDFFVPASAVQKMGDSARVFVLQDNAVRERVVALGSSSDDRIQVTSGLRGSERVVANPEKLREGAVLRK